MIKKLNVLDYISIVLSLAQTTSSIIFITFVLRYATFSKATIIFASVALIILSLLIDLVCYYFIRFKKRWSFFTNIIMAIVILVITITGSYYLGRINKSVDNIIITDNEQTETSTVAFVTYNNSNINTIDDLKGTTKFGYIDNESFIAGNVLALEVVEKNNLKLEMVPYTSYNDLILALFSEEIDVAALPDNYYQMFSVNDGYEDYLKDTKVIHTYSKEFKVTTLSGNDKDLTKDPFTVLLMGIDEQRTDSLMIATFNPQRMTVTMTSIARDSFVPIACYSGGARDKINHARTISRQCTIDTVENMMGVTIDFYVEVNFYGVVDMVDAMGGLTLYSPVTFIGQQAGYENDENGRGKFVVWVGQGWLERDGQQTLALARERHAMPGGDFARQENQQTIIKAMAEKMLNTKDLNKIIDVIEAAGDNIKTNFSLDQISQLINFGIKMLNSTYEGRVDGVDGIFKFYNTRVTGYESWTYNEQLSLPLWIYIPFKGSIADNKAVIDRNLQVNTTLSKEYFSDYDTAYPYYDEFSLPDTYNEQRENQNLPDIIPSFTNGYTLESIKTWLKDRSWIKLSVVEVKEGDKLYDASYMHNAIIQQSVAYGKKTADVKELTVWVIKHTVNCKLEEYRSYDDCGYEFVVPEFVGMSLSDLNTWINDHPGVEVRVTTIKDTEVGYNKDFGNKVSFQSVEAYTMLNELTGPIDVTYNKIVSIELDLPTIFASDKTGVQDWFNNNGFINTNITQTYNDSVPAGNVISVTVNNTIYTSASANPIVSTDSYVTVVISLGPDVKITVPTFNTVVEYFTFCEQHGLEKNVNPIETTDQSQDAKIFSQSASGEVNKSYLETNGLSIQIYQYTSSEEGE